MSVGPVMTEVRRSAGYATSGISRPVITTGGVTRVSNTYNTANAIPTIVAGGPVVRRSGTYTQGGIITSEMPVLTQSGVAGRVSYASSSIMGRTGLPVVTQTGGVVRTSGGYTTGGIVSGSTIGEGIVRRSHTHSTSVSGYPTVQTGAPVITRY